MAKNRDKTASASEPIPFANRERSLSSVFLFPTSRVRVGGRIPPVAADFSSIWPTNSGGLWGRMEKWIFSRGLRAGIAIRRFHRRPAGLTSPV